MSLGRSYFGIDMDGMSAAKRVTEDMMAEAMIPRIELTKRKRRPSIIFAEDWQGNPYYRTIARRRH